MNKTRGRVDENGLQFENFAFYLEPIGTHTRYLRSDSFSFY